ncbi:hypothetical protein AYI68_g475 [Smittium mucronatum]|uniref:Uncharacterized protein n=1 Tax=Smittium mucronatum TaxID=133383 RepID=A0A1R0H894_9FUNG|nr:hypothetical protein AYI68_g475 [Smittium mucronatum]
MAAIYKSGCWAQSYNGNPSVKVGTSVTGKVFTVRIIYSLKKKQSELTILKKYGYKGNGEQIIRLSVAKKVAKSMSIPGIDPIQKSYNTLSSLIGFMLYYVFYI